MSDDALNAKDNNIPQEIKEKDNSDEKSREERINAIISELNDLINDIRNSSQIDIPSQAVNPSQEATPSQGITSGEMPIQSQASNTTNVTVNAALIQTAQTLTAIDTIKTELCRLPLDLCEREYIANCVTPLETAMEFVSRAGFELATSVSILTTSPIVPRKKGKLKDTIHTIYSMNEEVEDIYNVLKHRLKKLVQEDNCC